LIQTQTALFMRRFYTLSFLLLLLGTAFGVHAQDQIEHAWYTKDNKAKVQIYKAVDGKFYGKIIWLKEPLDKDGKPKTDTHNSDKAHKSDPLVGLLILKGFKKEGADKYVDGTIYDPKNGDTYSCTIHQNGNNLHVRGYIGFSLLGRTEDWVRAD